MSPNLRGPRYSTYARASVGLLVALLLLVQGCVPTDSVGITPDQAVRTENVVVGEAVEALVGGALAGWWRASHGVAPSMALATAADAFSSSWLNFGMLDASREPRQPLNTDPLYERNFTAPAWGELYRTLAAVAHALAALDAGVTLDSPDDERRVRAVGRFLQGLALGRLAELYGQAYVLDETTDLGAATLQPYGVVRGAALERMDEAIQLASQGGFSVPAAWLGFAQPLTSDEMARLARSFRARIAIATARDVNERAAVDWSRVLSDVRAGITRTWGGYWNGDADEAWTWSIGKLLGAHPVWSRQDYRTIGPADASGAWQGWINAPAAERVPFVIDTDDRRITDETGTGEGRYMRYYDVIWFRPDRGIDHFSHYGDTRWEYFLDGRSEGFYPDFLVEELDFIEAEALYRLGDRGGAMALVNAFRTNGDLPPFTSPTAPAPGGDRCVPKRPDGSCGDLWDALKYEKRIELYLSGAFTEYTDDRGWGDLVPGTFVEFPPVPGDLESLVSEILGGLVPVSPDAAAPTRLNSLLGAYGSYDRSRARDPLALNGG